MIFTPAEVERYYNSRVPSLKLIAGQQRWRGKCPVHSGEGLNFSVDTQTGMAICHSQCGKGWDILGLEQELFAVDFPSAKETVFELVGRPKVPWEERNVEAIYDYQNAEGKTIYQVLRFHGKEFRQRSPNRSGSGWTWGLGGAERLPYRLPRWKDELFVSVVEGEKDVLTLESIGIPATCNSGGAGNFADCLIHWFTGKKVAIFADNDEPGRKHAIQVASKVSLVAESVKVIELPDVPLKGDVSDFVQGGKKTSEDLRVLYKLTQYWNKDWQFTEHTPHEKERFIVTPLAEIERCGGMEPFWNLAELSGLEAPWTQLSRSLGGGLRRGEVYVLGANQGAGKTSMALQFAMAVLARREGVLLFSMEMTARSVFHRMAGIKARINLNEVLDAQITLKRKDVLPEKIAHAQRFLMQSIPELVRQTREICQFPLVTSVEPSITPESLAEETTRISKRQKISLVIVDHAQLMGVESGSQRSEYEKFTTISRTLKKVAMTLNLPVLIVSQTSRHQSKEHRKELEVSDLRGSGAWEEDAAAVLLLYEDADDKARALTDGDRYTSGPVRCLLKIGKNRYGDQGRCLELWHCKATTHFESAEELEFYRTKTVIDNTH